MHHQPGSSAQRIRIGLTGLAFAFILVLLGSVVTRSSRDGAPTNAQQATANQTEPLAELGVAPGPAEPSDANNSTDAKR